jgi:hypothetical protein
VKIDYAILLENVAGVQSYKQKTLLTDHGGYIFHGARATGLTMAYRASGGNLKAIERLAGHITAKTALDINEPNLATS